MNVMFVANKFLSLSLCYFAAG